MGPRITIRGALLLLVLGTLACDGLRAPDAPIGSACATDEDCGSGYCLPSGCTAGCDGTSSDCPPMWSCEPVERRDGEPVYACRCPWGGSTDECGDGADQDCDGRVDEGCGGPSKMPGTDASTWDASGRDTGPGDCGLLALCGGECVDLQRTHSHCGGCGISCDRSAMCIDGACSCYAGAPIRCGAECVERIDELGAYRSVGPYFIAVLTFDGPLRGGLNSWFVDLFHSGTEEPVIGAHVLVEASHGGTGDAGNVGVETGPGRYEGATTIDELGAWRFVISAEDTTGNNGVSDPIILCIDS